ncbi:unnamed protein product [Anisakis simplex]|uniref:RAWUL domain-containing protein n=1 Tax=Anisakis simplex TaxID=6269 RepID=A0A3P6SG98_ANISI|nr:unnamed protein product [Anisakis simplex]
MLSHLSHESRCPKCACDLGNELSEAFIRDETLQRLVYKMVPDVYWEEMRRRGEFYKRRTVSNDEKALMFEKSLIQLSSELCAPNELVSLCIEYVSAGPSDSDETTQTNQMEIDKDDEDEMKPSTLAEADRIEKQERYLFSFKRYFRCIAATTIGALRKLMEAKLEVSDTYKLLFIDTECNSTLDDCCTLQDVAYMFSWKRDAPMRILFTLQRHLEEEKPPVLDMELMPELVAEEPSPQSLSGAMPSCALETAVQLPALTVSLNTSMMEGGSIHQPIITTGVQPPPRKKRKPSSPTKKHQQHHHNQHQQAASSSSASVSPAPPPIQRMIGVSPLAKGPPPVSQPQSSPQSLTNRGAHDKSDSTTHNSNSNTASSSSAFSSASSSKKTPSPSTNANKSSHHHDRINLLSSSSSKQQSSSNDHNNTITPPAAKQLKLESNTTLQPSAQSPDAKFVCSQIQKIITSSNTSTSKPTPESPCSNTSISTHSSSNNNNNEHSASNTSSSTEYEPGADGACLSSSSNSASSTTTHSSNTSKPHNTNSNSVASNKNQSSANDNTDKNDNKNASNSSTSSNGQHNNTTHKSANGQLNAQKITHLISNDTNNKESSNTSNHNTNNNMSSSQALCASAPNSNIPNNQQPIHPRPIQPRPVVEPKTNYEALVKSFSFSAFALDAKQAKNFAAHAMHVQSSIFLDPKLAAQPIKQVLSSRGMPLMPDTSPYLRHQPAQLAASFMQHLQMQRFQAAAAAGLSPTVTSASLLHHPVSGGCPTPPSAPPTPSLGLSLPQQPPTQQQLKLPTASAGSAQATKLLNPKSSSSVHQSTSSSKIQTKIGASLQIPTAHIPPFMSQS